MIVLTVNNLYATCVTLVFVAKDVAYNSRENNTLSLPKAMTTMYGIDTIRFIERSIKVGSRSHIYEKDVIDMKQLLLHYL